MTADKQLSVDVLQNKCSWKFRNTHSKTPALESFLKILLNIIKRLQHRCFTVTIAKFLRTSFLQNIPRSCFCGCEDFFSLQRIWSKTQSLSCYNCVHLVRLEKQPPAVFFKKAVPKYFAKCTGKHPCWSFFCSCRPEGFILKSICE